ncbi:hypothetical protein D3C80_1742950 [compost metagenome]
MALRVGQLLAQPFQCAGPASVQQQMRPLGRQLQGQGFPYAAAGAGEQYAFAFELHWQDPVS